MRNTAAGIQFEIAKGAFRPHTALTNMALEITGAENLLMEKLILQ